MATAVLWRGSTEGYEGVVVFYPRRGYFKSFATSPSCNLDLGTVHYDLNDAVSACRTRLLECTGVEVEGSFERELVRG